MENRHIAETDRGGLTLAQVGGNDVYRMLPQVRDVIEQARLGDDFSFLFSEAEDNGRKIDWYASEGDSVTRAVDLPPEEKRVFFEKLGGMLEKLHAYAQSLRKNPSENFRAFADILEKAMIVPGIESIYSVDGRPVFVNWGFSRGDSDFVGEAQKLRRAIADCIKLPENEQKNLVPEPQAQEAVAETRIVPEAVVEDSGHKQTEGNDSSRPEDLQGAKASEQEQGKSAHANPAPRPPVAAPAKSSRFGAWLLLLLLLLAAAFAAWYFLFRDSGQAEDALPDLAWLKGEWSAKGLLINENNQSVDLSMDFGGEDASGKIFIEDGEQICQGIVTATPRGDDKVLFASGELRCPDGDHYDSFTLLCERGSGICEGTAKSGDKWELAISKGGAKQ